MVMKIDTCIFLISFMVCQNLMASLWITESSDPSAMATAASYTITTAGESSQSSTSTDIDFYTANNCLSGGPTTVNVSGGYTFHQNTTVTADAATIYYIGDTDVGVTIGSVNSVKIRPKVTAGNIFSAQDCIDNISCSGSTCTSSESNSISLEDRGSKATKLVMTASPAGITQSNCSQIFTVQRQNASSTAFTSGKTAVSLSDDQGNAVYYSDSGCSTTITSVNITDTNSTASYYMKDGTVESLTVTGSATDLTSATDAVETLQTVDNFISALSIAGSGGGDFSEPSSSKLADFNALVDEILGGDFSDPNDYLTSTGYALQNLTDDTSGNIDVVALYDTAATPIGGTYLLYKTPTEDFFYEVPHPTFDSETLDEGAYLFQQHLARGLFIAGTHRCNSASYSSCSGTTSACGSSESYRISDVAHNTNTYFHEAHKAADDLNGTSIQIQLHGKSATSPTASISAGFTDNIEGPDAKSNTLADNFEPSVTGNVDSCNDSADGNILCGTTNVQGRYTHNSSNACTTAANSANNTDRFIHIEQNPNFRNQVGDTWADLRDAIGTTF